MNKATNASFIGTGLQQITFIYESPLILYQIYQKLLQLDKSFGLLTENYIPIEPPSEYAFKNGPKWLFLDPADKQSFLLLHGIQGITIQKFTRFNVINLPTRQYDLLLEKRQLRKILGSVLYEEIFISEIHSIEIIRLKIQHNQYLSIEQIISDIKQLFNKRLALFFEPNQLVATNFSLMKYSQQQLNKFWVYYSDIISSYWQKLQFFLNKEAIAKKYFNKRNQDLKRLFGEFTEHKCFGCSTRKINQHLKRQSKIKSKAGEMVTDSQDCFDLLENNTISLDISMKTTNFYGHFQEEKQQLPLSQEYPLINNYKPQPENRDQAIKRMMKSGIKPSQTCSQKCQCSVGKIPCPNLHQKVQCSHHNCWNSQIRDKKQVYCRYLGSKNKKKAYQSLNQSNIQYQVQEYYSFGLDFYTVRILYYLLPYAQRIGNQARQNQLKKEKFISMAIPQHVAIKESLVQAVQSLQYHQEWGYYGKVLHKKLRIIEKIAQQNCICKYNNYSEFSPNVNYLQAYYKGIGVRNSGKRIPTGQFIQKFVGQILQPWRQWQKQTIVTKISKQGYKNQKPNPIKFYCMSLQSHINQPNGIQTFSVDPQNKGNYTRSLNHSCNPNCSVQVYVSQGMYHAAVFSLRPIEPNEQLTFDYMSITDNYEQYQAASCLCGNMLCTGKYLRYHEVLYNTFNEQFMRKKYPIEQRFTDLLLIVSTQSACEGIQKFLKENGLNFPKSLDKSQNNWLLRWAKNAVDLMNYQLRHQFKQDIRQNSKTNMTIFISQLEYEQKSTTKNLSGYQQKANFYYDTLKKERMVSINTKISKILHYLQTSKDFSPPVQICSKQHTLFFLKSNQQKNCNLSIQQFLKIKMRIKKIKLSDYLKNSQKYRIQFVNCAKDHFKSGRLQEASRYLSVAFTFLISKIHAYPNFKSQPVIIWRENAKCIKQYLQYKGSDYMILNELLNWGDIKKQYQLLNKSKKFQFCQKTHNNNDFSNQNTENLNEIVSQQECILYLKYLCKKCDQTLIGFSKRQQIQKFHLLKIEMFDIFEQEIKKINQKSKNIWMRIQSFQRRNNEQGKIIK